MGKRRRRSALPSSRAESRRGFPGRLSWFFRLVLRRKQVYAAESRSRSEVSPPFFSDFEDFELIFCRPALLSSSSLSSSSLSLFFSRHLKIEILFFLKNGYQKNHFSFGSLRRKRDWRRLFGKKWETKKGRVRERERVSEREGNFAESSQVGERE